MKIEFGDNVQLMPYQMELLKDLLRSGQIFHTRKPQRKKRVAPFRSEQVEFYEEDTGNIAQTWRN